MKPNWLNENDYPSVEGTSPSAWAWEFLRRNSNYLADWEEFKSKIGGWAENYSNLSREDEARFLMDPCCEHTENTTEMRPDGQRVNVKKTTHLMNYYGEKWGLRRIADPTANYDRKTHRWINSAHSLIFPFESFDFDNPQYMVVAIDLERPLEGQLDTLRKAYDLRRAAGIRSGKIEDIQAKRKRFENYPMYLRVLDGNAAGATRPEMAEKLLPHVENTHPAYLASKNIDNWSLAAKKLSEDGYKLLPLIPEK